jgi:hypothetical protein
LYSIIMLLRGLLLFDRLLNLVDLLDINIEPSNVVVEFALFHLWQPLLIVLTSEMDFYIFIFIQSHFFILYLLILINIILLLLMYLSLWFGFRCLWLNLYRSSLLVNFKNIRLKKYLLFGWVDVSIISKRSAWDAEFTEVNFTYL